MGLTGFNRRRRALVSPSQTEREQLSAKPLEETINEKIEETKPVIEKAEERKPVQEQKLVEKKEIDKKSFVPEKPQKKGFEK